MKSIAKTLLVLSVIGLAAASPIEHEALDAGIEVQAEGDEDYRLPRDVQAINYDLEITPYFAATTGKQAWTFDGVAKISLKATVSGVLKIVLHMHDLTIGQYTLNDGHTGGNFEAAQYNAITDKWTITLTKPLSNTVETLLTVYYTGNLKDDMNGFYRSYYMEGTTKVWMATTQFQQTEARRAFPCFDEPGFRSTFKLTMNRPADMNTISNTNIVASASTATKDVFEVTPKMSSYLLAFIVSKYEGNKEKTVGVYARPQAKAQTKLSSDFAASMLTKFDEFLGLPYATAGNAKMDMAAIPDFSAGAMENWGLLTYRETNILYYPEDTPSINEQRIVAVIAHEMAHQWFGDLVTCNWWSETWLNEGFARYFQYFGTKMVEGYTDWDLEEQFVVENLQQSMQLDSTDSTHPMTNPQVKTKADSSGMFDNISYNKAASIIRMLSYYITQAKFQETLKTYLQTNKANEWGVEPIALFNAIDSVNPVAAGEAKVSEFFSPWTSKSGFPLVSVELKDQTLHMTQKRFMRNGIDHTMTDLYPIPITVAIDSKSYETTTPLFVFKLDHQTYDLTEKPAKYYILNPKQTGFYRVNYDAQNWQNIKEALMKENHDNIHVQNRAQIVDDLFNLARGGVVEYSTAIDIIRYIKTEKHYIPWLSAINHGLTFLSQRVNGEKEQEVFAWFIRDMMNEIYDHLEFTPAKTGRRTDIYNRANIMTWACKYGHEGCIKDAKEVFANFKTGKVPKDQRSFVYCNAIRHGDQADFDTLYNKFLTTDISAEQLNLLAGMGCTNDVALIKKYLDRLIDTDDIRPQDRTSTINNILNSNVEGPRYLYDYITQNHVKWMAKMGSLSTLSTVAGRFTRKEQFDAYETWLTGKQTELGAAHTSLKSSLDSSRKNLEWDAKYMKDFMDHITKLKNSAPAKVISVFVSIISVAVLYILN